MEHLGLQDLDRSQFCLSEAQVVLQNNWSELWQEDGPVVDCAYQPGRHAAGQIKVVQVGAQAPKAKNSRDLRCVHGGQRRNYKLGQT